jgi:hypothetical protein
MRNIFRGNATDGGPPGKEGWRADPFQFFTDRYHDGSDFTPFVRVVDPDRVLWDLNYAGQAPRDAELEHLDGLIFKADGKWVECTTDRFRVRWNNSEAGSMIVTVPVRTLQQFQLIPKGTAAATGTGCAGLVVSASASTFASAGDMSDDSLRILLTFEPQCEYFLNALVAFAESVSGRTLTVSPYAHVGDVPRTAHEQGPPGSSAGSQETGRQPGIRSHSPATESEPHVGREAGGEARQQNSARPELPKASDHLLTIATEFVPDTPEWLSFAAPTVQELLGHVSGQEAAATRDSVAFYRHDPDARVQHAPHADVLPES